MRGSAGLFVFMSMLIFAVLDTASTQNQGEMVLIPAGEFTMGSDDRYGEHGEGPAHEVFLSAFSIDRYEVTNAQYSAFLNKRGNRVEGGVNWLNLSGSKIELREGQFVPLQGYESHPVVRVTWYGAKAYAEWRGCRLPTEAEWERAVRGGFEGRTYYWGEDIDPAMANYGQDTESTTPVGSYCPNGYNLYDMTGNVWEWCNDWYERNYYEKGTEQNPEGTEQNPEGTEKNPTGSEKGYARIVRGGGWSGPVHVYAKYLRCSFRYFLRPESSNIYLGFRCAKNAKE